jgi:outer membrane protein TolC
MLGLYFHLAKTMTMQFRIKLISTTLGLLILQPLGTFAQAPLTNNQQLTISGSPITISDVLQRVIDYNESIQIKMIEAEISRRQLKSERAIFEPAIVGGLSHVDNERRNTAEQQANLFTRQVFLERNNLYDGGLEFLSPVGSRLRLGYNLRDLSNNLNQNTNEYVTTIGLTLTQPLLKGAGASATMVRIRLAAVASDVAFQDYRRQLMLTASRAEAAYWDLYLTQEQERISLESANTADALFRDNKARLDVGKSSEIEVLQAQAGLALRRTRFSTAHQKFTEAANQLNTLFSGTRLDPNSIFFASEVPAYRDQTYDYYEMYRDAFEYNPDYLSRKKQAVAEKVRLAYARNQLLPQVDLKASYGLNGLGNTPGASWSDASQAQFPSWSAGLEMRIPITGGMKERNDLAAAKLNQKKAILAIKEIEVQIGNALDTSMIKVRELAESVKNYGSVAEFNQKLLESQLARLEVGKTDSKTVLETEEKLFEAKIAVADNFVQYQKSLLELELIRGTVLRNRNLELNKRELYDKTAMLLAGQKVKGPLFDKITEEVTADYERMRHQQNRIGPDRVMKIDTTTPPPSDLEMRARAAARRQLETLEKSDGSQSQPQQ